MPKQKRAKSSLHHTPILYGAIGVLTILCVVLLFAYIHKNKSIDAIGSPSISLGSMQYRFSDGRAFKREDTSVKDLQAFLEADAAHERCPGQSSPYEHVVAYTKDETQVFIKYGCGAADSPAYAVKVNNTWKMLSPTNHFDNFSIPECAYLTENNISKEIAPVCANGIGTGTLTYSIRYADGHFE